MALLEVREPYTVIETKAYKTFYFGSVLWTLLLIIFSVLIFGFLAERFPPRSQTETHASMPASSRSPSAAELVPIYSGNPGGSTSLGGGTSFGGGFH